MKKYCIRKICKNGKEMLAFDMPYKNLYQTLEATAKRLAGKTGIIDEQRSVTFGELLEETDALAAYLKYSVGIERGDRVGILMVNSIAFCTAFYALMKLGATAIPMSTKLQQGELFYRIADCQMQYLFCDVEWYNKVRGILQQTPIKSVIAYGNNTPLDCLCYTRGVEEGKNLAPTDCMQEDDLPALVMYTSGTTGKPKGAVMTQFNLLQGMYAYAAMEMSENDRTVLAVPAFHITGLNCVMTVFVLLGGLQVMVPYFDAREVLDRMTEYRITHFHAVSTVYIKLTEAFDAQKNDLTSLHSALCGGGFIAQENIRRFCKIAPNVEFHPVYGMTETSGAGTYFPGHCLESNKLDSAGVCVPNCEMRIDREREGDGEICFRGAFVIDHYFHEDQNENITVDGWLRSGDIGDFDEDGYLYIKDRLKDMINRGGEKVFSYEVESVIVTYPGINEAIAFGVDDPVYGEVPAAVYVAGPEAEIDEQALIEDLRNKLAHYKVPVYLERRNQLPMTVNGKIRKSVLRKEFREKYINRLGEL